MRLSSLAPLLAAGAALAQHASLDSIVAQRIDGDRSRACVIAVLIEPVDGALAERRASRCATPDRMPAAGERFEIGSISKAFTGLLLSEMVERGEVALDDPVSKYFPNGSAIPDYQGRAMTLLDLATHTSGLPPLPVRFRPSMPNNPYSNVDENVIVGSLSEFKLQYAPGERYAYSNWAFMLLSELLGQRAGKPYDALLADRVLVPLGMKDTVVGGAERLRAGHTSSGRPTPSWDFPGRFGGVGAIRSTADDMARLARVMLGEVPAAVPETLKRAIVASTKPQREANPRLTMATAWHLIKRPEGFWVMHNGVTGGFSANLVLDLEARRAAFVLADASGGFDDIAYRLLDPASPLRPPARPVALDRAAAEGIVGRYSMRPGFDIDFMLDGDALYTQATGQQRFPIKQDSRGDYYAEVVDIVLRFGRDASGKATEVSVFQGGGLLRGKRVE